MDCGKRKMPTHTSDEKDDFYKQFKGDFQKPCPLFVRYSFQNYAKYKKIQKLPNIKSLKNQGFTSY
jgi:hypothetical protein